MGARIMAELKRRGVLHAAGIYAAVAFVALQVADLSGRARDYRRPNTYARSSITTTRARARRQPEHSRNLCTVKPYSR